MVAKMSSLSMQTYMKDFNQLVLSLQMCKSEKTENLLNRSLSLISASQNLHEFKPDTLECSQFYVNLHRLIACGDPKSDIVWCCISVLQQAARNNEARQALVIQFKFVPILAGLIKKIGSQEKLTRLLTLIQELSYGIEITWQEPYLADLITVLVEFIYSEDVPEIGNLALSILTNISYKNLSSIYLLMRTVHASTFSKKIQPYGALASKMRIILDNDVDAPNICELHYFIKKSFMDIEECMRSWNVPTLKHIVEFLIEAKTNEGIYLAMKEYQHFKTDIENLLKSFDSRMDTDEVSPTDDCSRKNQPICFALIFELIEFILQFDKSLEPIIGSIFNLALRWFTVEYASPKALDLITTIVKKVGGSKINEIAQGVNSVLPKVVAQSEKNDIPNEQIISLLKLLIALLQHTESQRLVFSLITESYFDHIFAPLLTTNLEMLNYAEFATEEIAKYLLCLLLLTEFSNIARNVWFEKLLNLLRMKQIHFVIAKGILSENEELCCVVFELSKVSSFPKENVSKIKSQLHSFQVSKKPVRPVVAGRNGTTDLLYTNRLTMSKTLEDRLDALITHIFNAKNNSEFNNVATSELIELFEYKTHMCLNREKDLEKRLESASNEITNLSHHVSLLSNEMTQYQSMNFKLHLTRERLQAEYTDVQKQRDTLKESLSELVKKIDAERAKYQQYSKTLDLKKAELEELKSELEKYKTRDAEQSAELKQMEAVQKESLTRIERLKKSIKIYEDNTKEKQRLFEEKEKENVKAVKLIEDFREKNYKMEKLIKHLEEQVADKNEAIKAYELELKETEEMRKTVLSLMQNKKMLGKRDS